MGPLKPKVTQPPELCGLRSSSLFERQVEHCPPGSFGQSQVTPDGRLAGVNARDACTHAFAHTHTHTHTRLCSCGFPGGSVVNTLPANAGDLGSISGLG